MDKEAIKKALEELRKKEKRKFKQTVDLIIVLKGLDLKKPEEQVDFYQQVPHKVGDIKICALIGPELLQAAKGTFDTVIMSDDFQKYAANKKNVKKLAKAHTFFIGQANMMPQIATVFGRTLGPRGKMPNPKAGCVVPPNANLKPLAEKLRSTARISAKSSPMIQLAVGKEDSKDEELTSNIITIYDSLIHHLPSGKNNIKRVLLKLTMSGPVKLE